MNKNQNKSQIQQGKHQVLMLPVFYVWSTELWNPCRPILSGWLPWEHRESLLGCLYSILVAVLCSYTTFPVYLLCCDLHCNLEFSLKILVNNLSFRVSRPELWPHYTLLDLVCLEIMGKKLNYAYFFLHKIDHGMLLSSFIVHLRDCLFSSVCYECFIIND